MPDRCAPPDLYQARLGLLSTVAALVRFARALDETSVERDTVRHAIRELSNALIRIYPTNAVEHAQGHAIGTLELLGPVDRMTDDGRVEISGVTVELYAETLARYLFAYGEEQQST